MDGGSSGQTDLAGALDLGDTGMAAYLANAGWAQIILLCLILGLLLSFTPCVLPMVPILLAILAGTAGTGRKVSRWRGVSLAAVFVLGMSLVYTALGIAAGLVGASLAVWLQTPWVLAIFALLLALLALAMFDVFTLQAPAGMQSALNERMSRIPGGHYSGAFVMGMLSALIVGPCVAAPLAGILLFISQSGDVLLGGSALFALAWGEGLLLLAVGASSGLLLPKAGAWMVGVKHLFGILLLATAWWMLNAVLPAWIFMLGWAVLSLWAATLLGAFEGLRAGAGVWRYLRKALGLLFALWGAALLIGLAMGGRDVLHPLAPLARAPGGQAQAVGAAPDPAAVAAAVKGRFVQIDSVQALDNLLAQTSRPVMLDFYADWCVSCIEMERFTFSDPQVAQLLSQFVLVQADVTKNLPEHRALLKRFKLFGPPGIMFFDGSGRQLEDIRVVGFRKARDFEAVLRDVLGQKTAPASAS
jgi:thiol:disulfide interchange protein DsbD